MSKLHNLAILGCGDFLRWQKDTILASKKIKTALLFDPMKERAEHYAQTLGGKAVDSADEIFKDKSIDIVCLFVPPWARRELMVKAARKGKHIITTKPLAANLADCTKMVKACAGKVNCSVFYRRTGLEEIETLKNIFTSGGIGGLGLFKMDWLHHYPTWNNWATDPEKNGGPFMDAMIHNLNTLRYLAGADPSAVTYFSDNHAQQLKCHDTESMKVDFPSGASGHLFITWAADLQVFSNKGNDREHIDVTHIVTNQGWFLTVDRSGDTPAIKAAKNGEIKMFPFVKLPETPFDEFVTALEAGKPQPFDITDAWKDIKILEAAAKKPGKKLAIDLKVPTKK